VTTMPVVDEKKLKLFFMRPPRDGMRQKLKDARRSVTDLGDGGRDMAKVKESGHAVGATTPLRSTP